MEQGASVDRRSFLGLSGAALAAAATRGALLGRVGGHSPGRVLTPVSGDVWAEAVTVTASEDLQTLSVDGVAVAAQRAGSLLEATVPLAPGVNIVTATYEAGPPVRRQYTCRLPDQPVARASVRAVDGGVVLEGGDSEPAWYQPVPLASWTWTDGAGTALGSGSSLVLPGPFPDGEHLVRLRVGDRSGRVDSAGAVFVVDAGEVAVPDPIRWQPSWVDGAVVYGALPPLFGEHPLPAVTAQLGRLARLGVDVVWLAPLFATTPGDFGYAVTDYFSVRPDYGTLANLRTLVDAAHRLGMRVILDLPVNDTSAHHPYFQAGHHDGRRSHTYGYYQRTPAGKPTHYFDWTDLPNLDYDNAEVRRWIVDVCEHWVRAADIDGYRVDAAWGVRARRPDFWPAWRAELARIRPDICLIAEGTARDSWWDGHGFDAAYDWTDQLGQWAWTGIFDDPQQVVTALRAVLARPPGSTPLRFLDDNDTGARFITRYGPGMARAAAALLCTLPGLPCLYTGTETGAAYQPYQQMRPLDWNRDPHQLEALYTTLLAARRLLAPLRTGGLTLLDVEGATDVLAYRRTPAVGIVDDAPPSPPVTVVINFGPAHRQVAVDGRPFAVEPWGYQLWQAV